LRSAATPRREATNTGTGTTSPGINLRKQGTDPAVNTFGIEGMAATASPGVENYVNGLNTSTSGTFGTGGTALLSATSGFHELRRSMRGAVAQVVGGERQAVDRAHALGLAEAQHGRDP